MQDDRTYTTNAPKGVALLDIKDPQWRQSENPATLRMYDSDHCILGQRYGTFLDGMKALFPDYVIFADDPEVVAAQDQLAYDYGFDVGNNDNVSYEQLDAHWTAILEGEA